MIIAGSRTIHSIGHVALAIQESKFTITEIVSGCANGVDKLGEEIANIRRLPVSRFPADWSTFGKSAGFMRNEEMGDYADALIAVWDGKSKGTEHMIKYMQKLEKPVFIYVPLDGKSTVSSHEDKS